jgi:hypothetical protein
VQSTAPRGQFITSSGQQGPTVGETVGGIVHRGAPGGQSAASIGQQGPIEGLSLIIRPAVGVGGSDGLLSICCALILIVNKRAVKRRSIASNYSIL